MGSVVLPRDWDVPVCYDAMAARGLRLGHGGLVALPRGRRPARPAAATGSRFMRDESCGRCAPCRLGSARAHALARRAARRARRATQLLRLFDVMEQASLCAFGQLVPGPMRELATHFRARVFGSATRERAAWIDGRARRARARRDDPRGGAARAASRSRRSATQPGLAPEGGCRICLVEVEGEARPQAACHTRARAAACASAPRRPALEALRRDVLALQVEAGGLARRLRGHAARRAARAHGVDAAGARRASTRVDASPSLSALRPRALHHLPALPARLRRRAGQLRLRRSTDAASAARCASGPSDRFDDEPVRGLRRLRRRVSHRRALRRRPRGRAAAPDAVDAERVRLLRRRLPDRGRDARGSRALACAACPRPP